MLHLIQQIIALYPNDTLSIAMENGNNTSGRPGSLLPATNPGLFELVDSQGRPQEAVSVCRIVSIRVTSAAYNDAITYLATPVPTPQDCGASCEAAVRPICRWAPPMPPSRQAVRRSHREPCCKISSAFWLSSDPTTATLRLVSTCKAEILEK